MIEKTQRRLRQAQFFYRHLLNPRHSTKGDPEAFEFYFSAFIQAARSVTWTPGNEEPEKWEAWKQKWEPKQTEEEKKLLKLTNDLRTKEVHQGGTDLTMEFEEVAVEALLDAIPHQRFIYPHQRRRLPAASTQTTIRASLPFHYFEDEKGKQEATQISRRYLDCLEKVVKGFCEDNQVE
jgi:hypothetical protein